MLQKETVDGPKDEAWGVDAMDSCVGLCWYVSLYMWGDFTYVLFPSVHYKEYLVTKINKTHLDPISLYDVHGLEAMLTREEMLVLERKYYSEDEYKERLMKVSEWSISSLCGVH